jgi:hypothetical protein
MKKAYVDVSPALIESAVFKSAVTVESAEILESGDIRFLISGDSVPENDMPQLVYMFCQPFVVEDYIVEGFANADRNEDGNAGLERAGGDIKITP